MTDYEAMKAAFLAKGGRVTVASEGVAYGVSAEADKAKRAAQREADRYANAERESEQRAESVREAYHVGGRAAAMDAMNAPARWRF